ncbi:MAG: hypothetical protein IK117_10170, partial [Bacteroidales bacterium]|nr:hypothetical protein [Bacteroidales bacterium]
REIAAAEELKIQIEEDMAETIEAKNNQIEELQGQIEDLEAQLAASKTQAEYDAILAQLTAKQTELATKTSEYNTLLAQYQELQQTNQTQAGQIETLTAEANGYKQMLIAQHADTTNRVLNHIFKSSSNDEDYNKVYINSDGTFVIKDINGDVVASSTYDLEHFRLTGVAKIAAIQGLTNEETEIDFEGVQFNINGGKGYNFEIFGDYFNNIGTQDRIDLYESLENRTFSVTLNGSKQYLYFYSYGEDSFMGGNAINIMSIHGENTSEFSLSKQSFVVDGNYNWRTPIADIFVEENGALTIQGIMYDQGVSLTLTEELQIPYEFLPNLLFDKTFRNANGGEFELAISEGENNTGVVEYSEYGNLVKTGTFSIATLKQYGYMDVLYTGDVEATRYTFAGAVQLMDSNDEMWSEYTDPDPYGLNMIVSNSTYTDGNGHILSFPGGDIEFQNLEDENNPVVKHGWLHGDGFRDGIYLDVELEDGYHLVIEFAQDGQTCQIVFFGNEQGEVDLSGYGEFEIQAQEPEIVEEPAGWNDEHQLLDILRSNNYTNGSETIVMVFDGTYYTANLIVSADDSYSMYGLNVLIDGYDITLDDGKGMTKTGTISADGLMVTFTGEETFTAIVY